MADGGVLFEAREHLGSCCDHRAERNLEDRPRDRAGEVTGVRLWVVAAREPVPRRNPGGDRGGKHAVSPDEDRGVEGKGRLNSRSLTTP